METDQLKQAIRNAGAAIPQPDGERLADVYARIAPVVMNTRRSMRLRWWHWLLLAGTASAMAGGYWSLQQRIPPVATVAGESAGVIRQIPPAPSGLPGNDNPENQETKTNGNGTGNGATIIYRH